MLHNLFWFAVSVLLMAGGFLVLRLDTAFPAPIRAEKAPAEGPAAVSDQVQPHRRRRPAESAA